MRTTVDIPEDLIKNAMKVTHVKTKTMAIILGLRELINHGRLQELQELQGKLDLRIDVHSSRKR